MRRVRRTTLITIGCLALLVGLGLARKIQLPGLDWLLLTLPAGLLALKNRNVTAIVVCVLLGLCLGLVRGADYMNKLSQLKAMAGQKVKLEVTASSDAIYAKGAQLEFTAGYIQELHPANRSLAGKIKVSGFGLPMVYRGDRLMIEGKLYPTRGSNQVQMSYAQLTLVSTGNDPIARLGRLLTTGLENAMPEPQASFGMGLLIGQRSNLPPLVVQELTMVGLVHIVAVSGYNLTILVRGLQRLRLRSKYQMTLAALALIFTFVLLTGFSASIVRAALISVLSLWAGYYGRSVRPLVLIAFTAALTGWVNPFYVWSDIGWYLSFLAFFGVLMIAPVLSARLFRRPPKILTTVLLETLSAELMTLPIIMVVFGQMSLIGLLANLLVVPLIPLAMLLAAGAAVAGLAVPFLAGWLAWPATMLLTYILDIVHLMAAVPSIFLPVSIDYATMLAIYASLGLALLVLHRHKNKQLASA